MTIRQTQPRPIERTSSKVDFDTLLKQYKKEKVSRTYFQGAFILTRNRKRKKTQETIVTDVRILHEITEETIERTIETRRTTNETNLPSR